MFFICPAALYNVNARLGTRFTQIATLFLTIVPSVYCSCQQVMDIYWMTSWFSIILYSFLCSWFLLYKRTPCCKRTFQRTSLNEISFVFIQISPAFVPNGPIDNGVAFVHIKCLCRKGNRPLSKSIIVNFTDECIIPFWWSCLTWICIVEKSRWALTWPPAFHLGSQIMTF